jgi:trimeric autotransporter adhesin
MSPTPRVLARQRLMSLLSFAILLSVFSFGLPAGAQPPADPPDPLYIQPTDRITSFIDDEQTVALRGNRHPMAVPQYDAGEVAPDFPMEHMLLILLPDSSQQEALNQLVDAQHNSESPYYHQWLTPKQYGERFGVSTADVSQIVGWLQGHGLEVEEVTAGHSSIIFSGTAAQVQAAFHTAIHAYNVGGELHLPT